MSGVSPTVKIPYYFWTAPEGATSPSQCICQPRFTGTNCEYSVCSNTLPGASLGSILFQADTKLRQFSSNASAYDVVNVESYLYNLLHVGVDVNGDGNITIAEMLTALNNRLIYSAGMTQLPLWCRSAEVGAYCYDNFGGDMVEVLSIYSDALLNFNLSGTFDGSGECFTSFSHVVHSPVSRCGRADQHERHLSCPFLECRYLPSLRSFYPSFSDNHNPVEYRQQSSNQTCLWICQRILE